MSDDRPYPYSGGPNRSLLSSPSPSSFSLLPLFLLFFWNSFQERGPGLPSSGSRRKQWRDTWQQSFTIFNSLSTLKEISPAYSLEGLILKLKLQYFGHLIWRADSLEKTLMLGKIEGRRRGWQRMRWLDGITDSMDMVWANSGRH